MWPVLIFEIFEIHRPLTYIRIGLLPHSVRAQRHRLSEGPIQRRLQYNMLCSSCMIFAAVVLIWKFWTDWVTFWQESVLEMPLHQQPKNVCFWIPASLFWLWRWAQCWPSSLAELAAPSYLSGHFHFPPSYVLVRYLSLSLRSWRTISFLTIFFISLILKMLS